MTPNGTAIRCFRKARGLSLRHMAAVTERSRGFLSLVERGQAGASRDTLCRIADALEIPVAAINREEMS
ncbi:helix-turn-helix domain-containing protein [Streptacidiphilus rugosus]|uniref:helix-turn-helix domain-containing protein n=1 Tax=Streptacidiphilus rugosus TaxID=405783 RepID=UPI0018DB3BFC|nr:helix-turn-helix transcriptional regulator [Streptacidiphilus rugosus]